MPDVGLGRQLGNLTFQTIGITEKLPEFLEDIGLHPAVQIPHLNLGEYDKAKLVDENFQTEFVNNNTADYELYTAALDHYNL